MAGELTASERASAASSSEEVVYEGVTLLATAPSPRYHYAIVLKRDKIRILLQDCDSRQQWQVQSTFAIGKFSLCTLAAYRICTALLARRCTRELNLEDYVDSTNSIPYARPADYVECFHELMNSTTREGGTDVPIGFYPHEGGKYRLQLAVKIQVLRQDRVAMYAFDLEPVSVERIDVLEKRVRGLEEVVKKLEGGISAQRNATMETFHAQGSRKMGDTLLWEHVGEGSTTATEAVSFIKVESSGVYQAVAVVNCEWKGSHVKLMKGSECIQLVYCGYASSYPPSMTLTCVTRLERDDQLSVVCPANIVATNRLTLVRLGN